VCPPPPLVQGGVTHSLVGEGVVGSQFRRGDIHCGAVGILYMYFVITKFCIFLHVLWKICNKKGAKGVQLYVQGFQYGGLFTAQEWPEGSLPLIPEKGQFAILDTEREC
jgi:hypothetical protein